MKPTKLALVLSLFSILLAGSAMAVTVPQIHGWVLYDGSYNGYVWGASVKACSTPDGSSGCYGATTNSQGYYSIYNASFGDNATIYLFSWVDGGAGGRTGRWGSENVPYTASAACDYRDQFGWCHSYGWQASITLIAAPLEPVAVDPAPFATNVGIHNKVFKWTSSSDSWRAYTNITYDIYGSGWGAPLLLQVSGLPCNPDANGNCQWLLPISMEPNTDYNWKIVAHGTKYGYTYTTDSEVYHFTTGSQ